MNMSLSFNDMFKCGSPLDISWNGPFGYPNHALTLHAMWGMYLFWKFFKFAICFCLHFHFNFSYSIDFECIMMYYTQVV